MWLALGTRPEIAFTASFLARFGHDPGRLHWEAARRVLRSLKGTRGGVSLSEESRRGSLPTRTRSGEATGTIDAQSGYTSSGSEIRWLVGSRKSSHVWRFRRQTERRRNRCGWWISWEVLVSWCRDQ